MSLHLLQLIDESWCLLLFVLLMNRVCPMSKEASWIMRRPFSRLPTMQKISWTSWITILAHRMHGNKCFFWNAYLNGPLFNPLFFSFKREKVLIWILRRRWHTFLCHLEVTVFPQLSTYHPLGRISLAMIYALTTRRVFIPQMMMMKSSLTPRQMLYECPLYYGF